MNLIYLGSSPAAAPYIISSKSSTGIYFGYFLVVLPLLALLNTEVLEEAEVEEAKTDSVKLAPVETSSTSVTTPGAPVVFSFTATKVTPFSPSSVSNSNTASRGMENSYSPSGEVPVH
jgi:hypothetical protein